jgi:carbon-monoxide dehydrogenase medium subunit/2-furoyl-CoA dehydrogenase FAD binding subunit
MGPRPLRARAGERALVGQAPTAEVVSRAAEVAMTDLEPDDDLHATRAYRLHVGQALTVRALNRALPRARAARSPL